MKYLNKLEKIVQNLQTIKDKLPKPIYDSSTSDESIMSVLINEKHNYAELARMMNQKSASGVRQYFIGKREPSVKKFIEICKAMGFDVQIYLVKKTNP